MCDYRYGNYEQPDPPHQPLYLEAVREVLKARNPVSRILDAGCGDGNFTASVAELGYEVYGIDLSPGGIEKAKARYPDISFACSSVYDDLRAAFELEAMFDCILSVEVIEHLYSPRAFMKRARESLDEGGLLILTTPYWGYWKNLLLAVTGRTDRALTPLWEGGHIKHWSHATLRELFLQNGFEVVFFRGCGRKIPFLWNGMIMAGVKTSR